VHRRLNRAERIEHAWPLIAVAIEPRLQTVQIERLPAQNDRAHSQLTPVGALAVGLD
jgi:hypothetical protein